MEDTVLQQETFGYATLEESKRARIQVKAEAIKMRMKRTAEDIIVVGQVKEGGNVVCTM